MFSCACEPQEDSHALLDPTLGVLQSIDFNFSDSQKVLFSYRRNQVHDPPIDRKGSGVARVSSKWIFSAAQSIPGSLAA